MDINSVFPIFKNRAMKYACLESYVTIAGDDEVLIENVCDVFECNEIMAKVRAGANEVVVWGENLKANCYNERSVLLKGKISSIEISKAGARLV